MAGDDPRPIAVEPLPDAEIARLGELLTRGDAPEMPLDVSQRLDLEAIEALLQVDDRDGLMGRLDVDAFGGLLDRLADQLSGSDPFEDLTRRRLAWDLLDLARRSVFLQRIPGDEIAPWADLFHRLVDASHLTVGPLLRQRADLYGYKVLFEVPRQGGSRSITWLQAASRIEFLARGLISLESTDRGDPVAILSENSLEMALVDLACLSAGIVNVMLPANATEQDVRFMLAQSGAGAVVVSGEKQLAKVLPHRDALPKLKHIITMDPRPSPDPQRLSLDELMSRAIHIPSSLVIHRSEAVRSQELATIMYTSGTTGVPKGIRFTHRNLVFKRFARALALPAIGDRDVFVCFLPLFHTFGRFLEMMGCVFWGATYCFVENPSLDALRHAMRSHRPSVFISVPKKWIQLYEAIGRLADPLDAPDEEARAATRQVVGDRLRWGLSAAGYLDPDIFRFFQRQGVELMSGFGMTEATGGITMTGPGEYEDDSLGRALPGIEIRLADDGELLARGPYVMDGYVEPPEGEVGFDDEGWFHTGDLMQMDPKGNIRLVDRKKEIYKNVKGETIAPQRIENLFRDFASVRRVFLVGDHKEFNTLLIFPNREFDEIDFDTLPEEEIRDYFRSLVVSVNKFLAPFERVVDFALIERDFDEERGELTPKGSPRRRVIAEHFADTIRALYRRTHLSVGGIEIVFPNWLFQSLGLTAQDLELEQDGLRIPTSEARLTVSKLEPGRCRIGDATYRHEPGAIDLGRLLTRPELWLGNGELVDFVPLQPDQRRRTQRSRPRAHWDGYAGEQRTGALPPLEPKEEPTLLDLDRAARRLADTTRDQGSLAIREMELLLATEHERLADSTRLLLRRAALGAELEVARQALRVLIPNERLNRFETTLREILTARPELLDAGTATALAAARFEDERLSRLIGFAQSVVLADAPVLVLGRSLLELLTGYASLHPTAYRHVRSFLTRVQLVARHAELRELGAACYRRCIDDFRSWLGPPARVAVDPDQRGEYGWDDVLSFSEAVPEEDRRHIRRALEETPFLCEALFLLTQGVMVRLSDVPLGGINVRPLGARHGKAVYRLNVTTRFQGQYDVAVNVNQGMPTGEIEEELELLLLCNDTTQTARLVEEPGGYYPEFGLWSEEFIVGETLDRALDRLSRQSGQEERLQLLWPFLAWSALSAYVNFWNRTDRRWEITATHMGNVIVPTQDYQSGARIVSLYRRRRHDNLCAMLQAFRHNFIDAAEKRYPGLAGLARWELVFASLLEVVGEEEGLRLLEQALGEIPAADAAPVVPADERQEMRRAFSSFRASVQTRGFLPLRLFFAVKRWRRWADLNQTATREARARTLAQVYETYGLGRLAEHYPGLRVRFFRETVFREAATALADSLEQIIARLRAGEVLAEEIIDAIADVRSRIDVGDDDDYFLARVSFPYLRPEDPAGFVSSYSGGKQQSEMVVTLEDAEQSVFRVRHALTPKEVERLHRLFVAARVDVHFRPEHQYLVALNERSQIIGGIYYQVLEDGETAHLEKIVVSHPFRRKGVAQGLMNEFFNRLRSQRIVRATTGFFRPEYFYPWGFKVDKRFAGLVKQL